jgi:hypothetical protein
VAKAQSNKNSECNKTAFCLGRLKNLLFSIDKLSRQDYIRVPTHEITLKQWELGEGKGMAK